MRRAIDSILEDFEQRRQRLAGLGTRRSADNIVEEFKRGAWLKEAMRRRQEEHSTPEPKRIGFKLIRYVR